MKKSGLTLEHKRLRKVGEAAGAAAIERLVERLVERLGDVPHELRESLFAGLVAGVRDGIIANLDPSYEAVNAFGIVAGLLRAAAGELDGDLADPDGEASP